MELEINGTKYIVEDVGNGFQYYKIVNNEKVIPTHEELVVLLAKLKEINTKKHTKEEIKELIKKAIDNNELTDENSIKDYLVSLNVTTDLEELEAYAKGLLETKNIHFTVIDEIREKLLKALSEANTDVNNLNKGVFVSFNRKRSIVGTDYVEVHLSTIDGDKSYEYPKMYCPYNEETKKQLIEPVLSEVALKSKVTCNKAINNNDAMEYSADYYFKTKANQNITVKDVDQIYAYDLEKKIDDLCYQYGNDLTDEEVQEVAEQKVSDGEELNLDKPMKLVRKKNEGFANSIISFIVAEVVAILLLIYVLLQLI